MALRGYLIRRVAQCVAVIFFVLTLNFLIFRLLPGDPVRMFVRDPRLDPAIRETIYRMFGLDKPVFDQYWVYLFQTFQGNLGYSFVYKAPVAGILSSRLLNSLLLMIPSSILSILIGLLIGSVAAWKRGTKIDVISISYSLLLYAMPAFWLGMLLLISFGMLGFPISGMVTAGATYSNFFQYVGDVLRHLALPLLTHTAVLLGQYALIIRSSLIDVLTEDYITIAKAKGLSDYQLMRNHALRNATLPLVTIIAVNLGFVVTGALETETVFSWPGVGRLMYDSLLARDYPMLQGSFLILTICVILANFMADIIYAYLDPRIKF